MKYSTLILLFGLHTFVTKAQKRIPKSALVWEFKAESTTDTVFTQEMTYDQRGNILSEKNLITECFNQYSFDDQNRIISKEFRCGNTDRDGLTTWSYGPAWQCQQDRLLSIESDQCDSLNASGQKVFSRMKHHTFENDAYYTQSDFYFYDKQRLARHWRIQWNSATSYPELKDTVGGDAIRQLFTYQYNDADSLILRTETNAPGGSPVEIMQCSYDPVSKRKIHEEIKRQGEIRFLKDWEYDQYHKLVKYVEVNNDYDLTLFKYYTYTGDELTQIKQELIRENFDTETTFQSFQNGLPILVRYESNLTFYACFYQYEFW